MYISIYLSPRITIQYSGVVYHPISQSFQRGLEIFTKAVTEVVYASNASYLCLMSRTAVNNSTRLFTKPAGCLRKRANVSS